MSRFKQPYTKFYASDWRSNTQALLTLEEEGLLIRACAYTWDTRRTLPADDRLAAKLLGVQVLKYIKLMSSLVFKGKMKRTDDAVYNERALADIATFEVERAMQSERALKGWATKRTPHHTPHPTPHLTTPVSTGGAGVPPPPAHTGKVKEINGGVYHREIMMNAYQNPESRIQKESPPVVPLAGDVLGDLPQPEKKRRQRPDQGARIPDDWALTPEQRESFAAKFHVTVARVAEIEDAFTSYWRSVRGASGKKLDWELTFNNRLHDLKNRGQLQARPSYVNGKVNGAGKVRTSDDGSGGLNIWAGQTK